MPSKKKSSKKEKKVTKKADLKPEAPDCVKSATGRLLQLSEQAKLLSANCVAIANDLAFYFAGTHSRPMESWEAAKFMDNMRNRGKLSTPMGEATAPPDGKVPKPVKDGEWTAKELANTDLTRPILGKILEGYGGDSTGKMAPALRTEILKLQVGPVEKIIGECDITGDTDVELTPVEFEGEEYRVCQRVLDAINAEHAQWSEIFSGEYELEELE